MWTSLNYASSMFIAVLGSVSYSIFISMLNVFLQPQVFPVLIPGFWSSLLRGSNCNEQQDLGGFIYGIVHRSLEFYLILGFWMITAVLLLHLSLISYNPASPCSLQIKWIGNSYLSLGFSMFENICLKLCSNIIAVMSCCATLHRNSSWCRLIKDLSCQYGNS